MAGAPPPRQGGHATDGVTASLAAADMGSLIARAKGLAAAQLAPLLIETAPSLAAIWAAPHVGDRHALLGPLATAAGHWDHHVAAVAATSARTIARQLTPGELEAFEVLGVELDVWLTQWQQRALADGARNDVRVLAAEVVFALAPLRGTPSATAAMHAVATAFRAAPDPELQRVIADLEVLLAQPSPP